jgi:hypothetical protein
MEKETMEFISNKPVTQYCKAEDRVTAEFLKIVKRGGFDLVTFLFGDMMDVPSCDLFVDTQYYPKGHTSHPDGLIAKNCNFRIFIESKIRPNDINVIQLNNHLRLLSSSFDYLVYITPDTTKPKELIGTKAVWISWQDLLDKLKDYASSCDDPVIQYLVGEFELTLMVLVFKVKYRKGNEKDVREDEIFIDTGDDRVIIVGGSWAEDIALEYKRYICQPNRYFLPARYIAFCFDHRIKYLFKIVGDPIEAVDLRDSSVKLGSDYFTNTEPYYNSNPDLRKVFFLELVKEFSPVIVNDSVSKNGKRCAFVQRQRYTTYTKIIKAKFTSNLI